jgi:Mrp family chromosome partitioning ATPase
MPELKSLKETLIAIHRINMSDENQPLALPPDWWMVADALRGWVNGMVIVAGQANHGKSSTVTNLALALMETNPDMVVLDFSLDDDKRNRVSRYVAAVSYARINDVLFEHRTKKQNPTVWSAIHQAYHRLSALDGRLYILDAGDIIPGPVSDRGAGIPTIEAISQVVLESRNRHGGPMLILLDSLNEVGARIPGDELDIQRYVVQRLSVLANQHNVRILATAHLRKDVNWKNPSIDDVYGGSVIKYFAKVVTFIYNESKEKGGAENASLAEPLPPHLDLYAHSGNQGKTVYIPVLAWIWKKSKVSDFDGRLFFRYIPYSNTVIPISVDTEVQRYNSLINEDLQSNKQGR